MLQYRRFKKAWLAGNPNPELGDKPPVKQIDEVLHAERLNCQGEKPTYRAAIHELPDATFVRLPDAADAFLLWRGKLHRWTSGGYDSVRHAETEQMVEVLMPRSIVQAVRAGYEPVVHTLLCEAAGVDESYVDTLLGGGSNTAERSEDVVELAAQARHLLKAVLPAVVTGEGMELGSFSLQLLREAEQFVAKKKSGTQAPSPNTETDVERLVRKLPNAGGRFRCFAVGPESAAAQAGIQELEDRLQKTAARMTFEAERSEL